MKLNKLIQIALQNMAQHGKTSTLGGMAIATGVAALERGNTVAAIVAIIAGVGLTFYAKDKDNFTVK